MPLFRQFRPLLLCGLIALGGCDSFDEEAAALQIRDRFCEGWPYGCTDSTYVVVEDVNETPNGREIVFRVRDREDETAELSAAYFEPRDDEWHFFTFVPPLRERFQEAASQVDVDSRAFEDQLMEVKSAQRWFLSIYGRYARSLEELDSVSYKRPHMPIEMSVSGGSWSAVMRSEYVKCEFDSSRMQLPSCTGLAALNAGVERGPLARNFGEED